MRLRVGILRALIAFTQQWGTKLRDRDGQVLCRAFVVSWRGTIHLIGLPNNVQLRPMPMPQTRLSYWKQAVVWEQAKAPDFPRLEKPSPPDFTHVCHVVICHLPAEATAGVYEYWRSRDPEAEILIVYGGSEEAFRKLSPEINAVYVPHRSLRTSDHARERQQYHGAFEAAVAWLEEKGSSASHIHLVEFDAVPVIRDVGRTLVEALAAQDADVAGYGLVDITRTIHPHNRHEIAESSFIDFLGSISAREVKDRIFTMLGCSSIWTRACFEDISRLKFPRVYLEIGNPTLAHHLGYRVRPMPAAQERFVSFEGDFTERIREFREEGAWLVHPCKNLWKTGTPEPPAEEGRKPRLLLCGHTYGVAVNRAKATALGRWFEVMVCSPDFEGIQVMGKDGSLQDWDIPDATYEYHRLRRWPRKAGFTRSIASGLGERLRGWKPDVVLCEAEPWAMLRWQCLLLTRLLEGKTVFTEFTWENMARPGYKGTLLKQLYRLAVLTTDGVICGNRGAESLMQDAGLHPSRILRTGQLGVEPSEHPAATPEEKLAWKKDLGFPADAFVVGFCGRFIVEKGVFELIEAVESLRAGGLPCVLAFLGTGALQGELEAMCASRPWLRLLPPVSHSEVPGVVNRFDLFVLPSKPQMDPAKGIWEEQFGHVLIEAMMAGTPCIGSNSGGIPEVLEQPDTLFPPGDSAAIAALILRLIETPGAIRHLAEKQRDRTLALWNHDALAGRYAEFLLGLISIKKGCISRGS